MMGAKCNLQDVRGRARLARKRAGYGYEGHLRGLNLARAGGLRIRSRGLQPDGDR
jgi:hypothetical protein